MEHQEIPISHGKRQSTDDNTEMIMLEQSDKALL